MVASHKGHVDVVEKLLEHGARIDLQYEVCKVNLSRALCDVLLIPHPVSKCNQRPAFKL